MSDDRRTHYLDSPPPEGAAIPGQQRRVVHPRQERPRHTCDRLGSEFVAGATGRESVTEIGGEEMKITFKITTEPESSDAEDAVHNMLQDSGIREEFESWIETIVTNYMGWYGIRIKVEMQ